MAFKSRMTIGSEADLAAVTAHNQQRAVETNNGNANQYFITLHDITLQPQRESRSIDLGNRPRTPSRSPPATSQVQQRTTSPTPSNSSRPTALTLSGNGGKSSERAASPPLRDVAPLKKGASEKTLTGHRSRSPDPSSSKRIDQASIRGLSKPPESIIATSMGVVDSSWKGVSLPSTPLRAKLRLDIPPSRSMLVLGRQLAITTMQPGLNHPLSPRRAASRRPFLVSIATLLGIEGGGLTLLVKGSLPNGALIIDLRAYNEGANTELIPVKFFPHAEIQLNKLVHTLQFYESADQVRAALASLLQEPDQLDHAPATGELLLMLDTLRIVAAPNEAATEIWVRLVESTIKSPVASRRPEDDVTKLSIIPTTTPVASANPEPNTSPRPRMSPPPSPPTTRNYSAQWQSFLTEVGLEEKQVQEYSTLWQEIPLSADKNKLPIARMKEGAKVGHMQRILRHLNLPTSSLN